MSIIEKAVDKLMRDGGPAKARGQTAEHGAQGSAAPSVVEAPANTEQAAPQAAIAELAEPSHATSQPEAAAVAAPGPESVGPDYRQQTPAGDLGAPDSTMVSIRDLALEGIISADSERSRAAEEYRMIKRPLLTRAFSGRPQGAVHQNLIMITSSVEGEGKTFSSLNLAISIAMEMDRTVLLVDADLAKPGLSRLLRINDRPGLTDRLIDESIDLSEVLLPTDIPKFNILPAGRRHRRSTELLSSSTMRRLLDELALRYSDRVVLFDSPPLLATSEASALAQQMGQICLVVESAVTPQFLVKDALARLENTENVSLVLNKCKPDLFLGRYGYGYGYQYGYGYGYGYGQNDK